MCIDPVSLSALTLSQVGAGISVLGAVSSFAGQNAQADAVEQSNAVQRQQFLDEQDRARMDGARAAQQEYEKAASEANAYSQEHAKSMAAAQALLGESGGVSAERKLSSIGIQNGQDMATLASNSNKAQAEIGLNTAASVNATSSKFASLKSAERPSLLGLGLTIAGAGMSYAKDVKAITTPKVR